MLENLYNGSYNHALRGIWCLCFVQDRTGCHGVAQMRPCVSNMFDRSKIVAMSARDVDSMSTMISRYRRQELRFKFEPGFTDKELLPYSP
jgi:hypothetical protein